MSAIPDITTGPVPFTSAQVHAAIATLRALSSAPNCRDVVMSAESVVRGAFQSKGWTGATEGCPPFGALSEQSQAQIDHLAGMVERASGVNALMESFIQRISDDPDIFADCDKLKHDALLVMHNAALTAQGLPVVDKLPEE